ncbi:MAG: hypothetical protein IKR39_03005 [Lachnospiraceae bacterium]|nr:hypothetical protein [Lachnospiraceae bacterium]
MTEKKISPIRVILFAVAFAAAIFFITRGIYKITNQDPGYYNLDTMPDEEAGLYASGITCTYLFEGSSNAIKQQKKEAEACYTGSLVRLYKLTDPDKEYTGYTNLCTISKNIGKDVTVSEELYNILEDAYKKTALGQNYSVFAGAFYSHWRSILSLEEPEEFDPVNNTEEKERLEELYSLLTDSQNFKLIFKDDNVVRLEVSDAYLKRINDMEESATVLDLNVLREAYMLQNVSQDMKARGFTKGRITTDLGLYVDLGDYGVGGYTTYSVENGKAVEKDIVPVSKAECMCGFVSVPVSDRTDLFYSVSDGTHTYYRSPFALVVPESYSNYVGSAYAKAGAETGIVNTAYRCMMLYGATSAEEAENALDEIKKGPASECVWYAIK